MFLVPPHISDIRYSAEPHEDDSVQAILDLITYVLKNRSKLHEVGTAEQ